MSVGTKWHANPAPHRRLRRGHRGEDVRRFQAGLEARAKHVPMHLRRVRRRTLVKDGVFGDATLALWREIRWAIGLPANHPPTIAAQLNVRNPKTRSPQAIKRAKERRKRPVAEGQLTPNFNIREFACKDGTPAPSYMEGPLRDLCRRVLEPLRKEFGPCTITSGYRHAAYNRSIGGASQSYHVYEIRRSQPAADVTFASGTPQQWANRARQLLGNAGGVGLYPRSRFVHVDTRTYRSDWSG